jgi:hypothetical protein
MMILSRAAAVGVVLALGAASPAFADAAAGSACAAKLTPQGQAIYAGAVSAGGDVRAAITSSARSLVMSGQMDQGTARANAEAAGKCLELARS